MSVYAPTVDFGPYFGVLQAFGPPEVVPLDPFAGNVAGVEEASGFWEIIGAVSFTLATSSTAGGRVPRLDFFESGPVPFASIVSNVGNTASHTSRYTFAVAANAAGAQDGAAILVPLPGFLILPGWEMQINVGGGVAGDAVSDVLVYRQRYRLVDVADRVNG